jgi:hypothetical protein
VERLESAEERHEMLVRVNRQLGRRVGAFDDGVYMGIVRILSKLLVENGARKD